MDRARDPDPDYLTPLPTEVLVMILAMVPFHGGLMRVSRRFRDVVRGMAVPGDTIERNLIGSGVLFWRGLASAGPPGMVAESFRGLPVDRLTPDVKRMQKDRLEFIQRQFRRLPMSSPTPLLATNLLNEAAGPQTTVAGDRGDYEMATNTMIGPGRDTISLFRGLDVGTMILETLQAGRAAAPAGAAAPGLGWFTDECRELAGRARTMPGFTEASRAEAVALYERTRDFIEAVCQLPGRQRGNKFVVFRMGVAGLPLTPQFQFNLVVPVFAFSLMFSRWSSCCERDRFEGAGMPAKLANANRTQKIKIVRDEATGQVVSVTFATCLKLLSDSIPHTLWRLKRGGGQQIDFPRAKRTEFRLYMRNTVVATPENRAQLEAEVSGLERRRKRDAGRV